MTYQEVVNSLKLIANAVSPNATWYRGRLSDISLKTITSNQILIYCVDDFTPVRSTDDFDRFRFTIAFLKQDSPVSESMTVNQVDNEDSREEIYNEMYNLARSFKDTLQYNDDINLPVDSWEALQLTRKHEGVFTGWAVNFSVIVAYECDDGSGVTKICADSTYQNSDGTFVRQIESGFAYTAPDITVTDVDGSQREVPANKDIVCIASAPDATAVLKNSAGTTLSTTEIASGATDDITAPDATAVIKNTSGTVIDTEAIPSNVSEDITIPNVAWTDSDGSAESTPYGNAIVCTPQSTLSVDFSANDTTPDTNQTVTFTDLTVGGTTWLWDFGDGELSDAQNPTHAYKYAGTYTVTLHVDSGTSGGFTTKTNYITVTLQSVYQTNLQMHNKAPVGAAPSNLTLVGANVSQWNDDTANAYHRTQGTAANRPTYTQVALTVPDGTVYGSVDYDGSNDALKNNNAAFTRVTGSYEVIVFKATFPTNSGARSLLCAGAAGGSRYLSFYNHGGAGSTQAAGVVLFNGGTVGTRTAATEQNQFCVLSIHWNGTSSTVKLNDNTVLTPGDVIGTSSSQGSTQGNNADELSPFLGSVMEHIIWSSKPSDADIAEYIDKYLASKFGLW